MSLLKIRKKYILRLLLIVLCAPVIMVWILFASGAAIHWMHMANAPWEDYGSTWSCEDTGMVITVPFEDEHKKIICSVCIDGVEYEYEIGCNGRTFALLYYYDEEHYSRIVFSGECRYYKSRFICDIKVDDLFGMKDHRVVFYKVKS